MSGRVGVVVGVVAVVVAVEFDGVGGAVSGEYFDTVAACGAAGVVDNGPEHDGVVVHGIALVVVVGLGSVVFANVESVAPVGESEPVDLLHSDGSAESVVLSLYNSVQKQAVKFEQW